MSNDIEHLNLGPLRTIRVDIGKIKGDLMARMPTHA
jgi:hypothetical protein